MNYEQKMEKKRSRFLAFLFSLIQPGLGQLYKGESRKYLLFLVVGLAIPLAAGAFAFSTFNGLVASVAAIIAFYLWCLTDAVIGCRRPRELLWYNRWYWYIGSFILGIVLSSFVKVTMKSAFHEAYKIPSSSMTPTLQVGDHIMVDKGYYRSHPAANGDVVVLLVREDASQVRGAPEVQSVKRIVGIAGDIVEVHGNQFLLNGVAMPEPYAKWDLGGISDGNFGPQTVPAGRVFLLGDNRDHSKDSRFWGDPFPPIENIIGKVRYIYWSSVASDRMGLEVR